jgi:hypothetical protein
MGCSRANFTFTFYLQIHVLSITSFLPTAARLSHICVFLQHVCLYLSTKFCRTYPLIIQCQFYEWRVVDVQLLLLLTINSHILMGITLIWIPKFYLQKGKLYVLTFSITVLRHYRRYSSQYSMHPAGITRTGFPEIPVLLLTPFFFFKSKRRSSSLSPNFFLFL